MAKTINLDPVYIKPEFTFNNIVRFVGRGVRVFQYVIVAK